MRLEMDFNTRDYVILLTQLLNATYHFKNSYSLILLYKITVFAGLNIIIIVCSVLLRHTDLLLLCSVLVALVNGCHVI